MQWRRACPLVSSKGGGGAREDGVRGGLAGEVFGVFCFSRSGRRVKLAGGWFSPPSLLDPISLSV